LFFVVYPNMESELKNVVKDLVQLAKAYADQLKQLDPTSREAARVTDALTKILGRVKDFEAMLQEEDVDLVMQLSQVAKKPRQSVKDDRLERVREHVRALVMELED